MQNNTTVTFRANGFNTSEAKPYYLNPNCYGDDLAQWMIDALREAGVQTEESFPEQEDFGWYFNFFCGGETYSCVVLYEDDSSLWRCVIERDAGLIRSLLGARRKRVSGEPVDVIDGLLRSSDKVSDVQWHNQTEK